MIAQLKKITEILKTNPQASWSYEDFAAMLYSRGIRALPVKAKEYIVCCADNVGYDIEVYGPYTDKADALTKLIALYGDAVSLKDDDMIDNREIGDTSYLVQFVNGDLYYGSIKEIEVEVK